MTGGVGVPVRSTDNLCNLHLSCGKLTAPHSSHLIYSVCLGLRELKGHQTGLANYPNAQQEAKKYKQELKYLKEIFKKEYVHHEQKLASLNTIVSIL